MSSLVVGGVVIPVAVSSPSFSRSDAVDRGRMFDNTYYASLTGGAAREWDFSTPPVTTTDATTYSTIIGRVAAQLCSGDILDLPTMCYAEYTGGTPVRTAVGHRVVLNFRLHEVQPERVLLRYTPGDTIAGETFTRSTVGYQIDAAGLLVSKAINVKRDGHYIGGVRSLLLEDTRTNNLPSASEFADGAWIKTNVTIGSVIPDPTGGTAASTLTATAGNGTVEQNIASGASIVRTNSVWLKRRTGTGTIQVLNADGSLYTTVTLTAGWSRFPVPASPAAAGRWGGIKIVTSGDAIDAFISQNEDGAFSSSSIQTTTAATARGAESYSLPFTLPPMEMTVFIKFVELGSLLSGTRIFEIAAAADTSPRFLVSSNASVYGAYHGNDATAVSRDLAVAPTIGDTVEIMARLFGDGSVDITQSINGAAATVGVQTSANPLAAAWSDDIVWLNSVGSGPKGFMALQSFKIIAGSRGLAEMRAL